MESELFKCVWITIAGMNVYSMNSNAPEYFLKSEDLSYSCTYFTLEV